ncbi:MAG: chromate efflux transporter [Rhodanobacteraceae bacterium]|nr:chromate efflux transporter [Rhodanobacteraceae bacterium]
MMQSGELPTSESRPRQGYDVAVWAKIGLLSFGGPAGQIALMHRRIVDELKWLSESQFLAALNFCMLLPGPEAQQLATYIGWHRAGWRGALVAGWLFVLPGVLVMYGLCWAYVSAAQLPGVAAALLGVKCAVMAILVQAVVRLARRALRFRGAIVVAVTAFFANFLLAVPYPLTVLASGLCGYFSAQVPPVNSAGPECPPDRPNYRLVLATAAAWLLPTTLLVVLLGTDHLLVRIALFFSEVAVVTFGGAYAVLGYVADHAVQQGWLSVAQMTDGLGLAETTPGPLILVLQFVAFLAGSGQYPGPIGWLMATAASALAIWTLFLPSFMWVFLGAPHLQRLNAHPRLQRALSYITAAVMGVILNVSVWFIVHVMFAQVAQQRTGPLNLLVPDPASFVAASLVPIAVACCSLFVLRYGVVVTLALSAAAGLLASWV